MKNNDVDFLVKLTGMLWKGRGRSPGYLQIVWNDTLHH